jgi:hypothetical protein
MSHKLVSFSLLQFPGMANMANMANMPKPQRQRQNTNAKEKEQGTKTD